MMHSYPSDIRLGPPKNGTVWPYVVLPVIGFGMMIYLTIDLYLLLSRSGSVHPNDWWVVAGMLGITGLFALMAIALWYAPWSRASLHLTDRGFTLEIRGLHARRPTRAQWSDLMQVTMVSLSRGASYYRLDIAGHRSVTFPILALAADPPEVLAALDAAARRAGYHLSGQPLSGPVIGRRRWQVLPLGGPGA
ncbi:hypothetical protein [Gymnodinialimonas ulvae]|uniref:hypothetical protein n=1 Tax=Gymnodinialimonas ulvae TaxID=3126504 RepID=UPI003098698A